MGSKGRSAADSNVKALNPKKTKKNIWFGLSIQTVLKLDLYQLIFSVIIRKCIPQ